MKRIFDSNKIIPLLLMIISVLLGVLGFLGKRQVEAIDSIGKNFTKFQIQTIKNNSILDKTLEINRNWTHEVYDKEIHPNTIRSQKNEKDIIKVKSDINNIKTLIK